MDLKKAQEGNENKNEDFVMGNWTISTTMRLIDFHCVRDTGLPLAFCLRSRKNLDCVFIDMFSQNTSVTNITDFGSTIRQEMNIASTAQHSNVELLYTKEGWMLFLGPNSAGRLGGCFFLFNIFTGKRLQLPDITGPNLGRKYVFSTSSSSVDYVINVRRQVINGSMSIYVARPHDQVWKACTTYNRHGINCFDYIDVIIFEKRVYCFEAIVEETVEIIDLFDLVEDIWVSITVLQAIAGNCYKFHVIEVDGIGIVKVYLPNEDFNMYRFYRLVVNLNDLVAVWVELTEQELENKSWFVGRTTSLCVKSPGRETAVYTFTSERLSTKFGEAFGMDIQVYDLKAATSRTVFACPTYPAQELIWVHLE